MAQRGTRAGGDGVQRGRPEVVAHLGQKQAVGGACEHDRDQCHQDAAGHHDDDVGAARRAGCGGHKRLIHGLGAPGRGATRVFSGGATVAHGAHHTQRFIQSAMG